MKNYIPIRIYKATSYRGKPAVLDVVARVYYFGFSSMKAAQARADKLNSIKG